MKIKKSIGRKTDNLDRPIKLILDIATLDILCRYVISSSSTIRASHISNLKKLIDIIDPSTYENDPEKRKRFEFIEKGIEARLDYHLTDQEMILKHIQNKLGYDLDFVDTENTELNMNELDWIHQLVSESIKYQFIYNEIDDIQDICTRFSTSDYIHRGEIVEEFEEKIDELKNEFRKVDADSDPVDMTFSLRDGVFEDAIKNTYSLVTSPNRRLICGMTGLNEMVGGGFEAGRVYALFGLGGIGKSLTLLNLMVQFKKYNKYYRTKDPTKTPCIVLLTMENTVVETITRLFAMTDPNGKTMLDYPNVDDVISILRNQGQLYISDDSPIDIVIKYKANKSVDTSYLYTLYDDLADEGYEVICMIQDHIKRIRSVYRSDDLRIELGDIVNEMKVFAAEKDIPFITVSHLNRDAAKVVEKRSNGAASDVTRKLGKSNVGESLLMIDNLDCGIVMNLETDQDGNQYMCYNLIKMRDKVNLTYIAQPFEYGSSIKLVEDVGGLPVYRTTLKTTEESMRTQSLTMTQKVTKSNIDNIFRTPDTVASDNSFSESRSLEYNDEDDEEDEDDYEEENFFRRDNLKQVQPQVEQKQPEKKKGISPIYFFGDPEKQDIPNMDKYKDMVKNSANKENNGE